jgi:hypothetical protein
LQKPDPHSLVSAHIILYVHQHGESLRFTDPVFLELVLFTMQKVIETDTPINPSSNIIYPLAWVLLPFGGVFIPL